MLQWALRQLRISNTAEAVCAYLCSAVSCDVKVNGYIWLLASLPLSSKGVAQALPAAAWALDLHCLDASTTAICLQALHAPDGPSEGVQTNQVCKQAL